MSLLPVESGGPPFTNLCPTLKQPGEGRGLLFFSYLLLYHLQLKITLLPKRHILLAFTSRCHRAHPVFSVLTSASLSSDCRTPDSRDLPTSLVSTLSGTGSQLSCRPPHPAGTWMPSACRRLPPRSRPWLRNISVSRRPPRQVARAPGASSVTFLCCCGLGNERRLGESALGTDLEFEAGFLFKGPWSIVYSFSPSLFIDI